MFPAPVDRVFSAEQGFGSVLGIVMDEWTASPQLIHEGLDPRPLPRMLIISATD